MPRHGPGRKNTNEAGSPTPEQVDAEVDELVGIVEFHLAQLRATVTEMARRLREADARQNGEPHAQP